MHEYEGFARAFDAEAVRRRVTPASVVAISGDALTGKSTLAGGIAAALGYQRRSAGEFARTASERNGLPVAEAARVVGPDDDRRVDLAVLMAMADPGPVPLVIEGRLAVHLATWLRSLGKREVVRISVRASARERAARLVGRVLGPAAQEHAERVLPRTLAYATLADVAADLGALPLVGIEHVAAELASEAERDARDRRRLQAVYAFDYAVLPPCEVELDTGLHSPETTVRLAVRRIAEVLA